MANHGGVSVNTAALITLVLLFFSVGFCSAAQGENDWNDWYFGALGTYIDAGDERTYTDVSGQRFMIDDAGGITFVLGHTVRDWLDIEAAGNYSVLQRDISGGGRDIDLRTALGLDLLWVFNRHNGNNGAFMPHLAFGGGVVRDDVSIESSTNAIIFDEQETTGYLNAGIGFRVPLIENGLRLRFDARYVMDFVEDASPTGDKFEDVYVSLGIELPFGGKAVPQVVAPTDTDGDGVPDTRDRCPNTPAGVRVGPDGCPLDSDGDGVPDYQDRCPNTPQGVEVGPDGCPLDRDGDGVPDYRDKCPGTPAGVEVGPDGCPLDSDGDGVPDYLDHCPNTQQGLEVDDKGCAIAFQTITLHNIAFEFDKAQLLPSAKPFLNNLAKTLKGQPTMRVRLNGHTDSVGSESYNQTLSDQRAQAVKDYLVALGIRPDRIESMGYGESRPIAPNTQPDGTDNPEGRALNRRTELQVLAK